jgi:hypothetical protein
MQVSHTKNMRAAIVTKFGGPEVLELTEIPCTFRPHCPVWQFSRR